MALAGVSMGADLDTALMQAARESLEAYRFDGTKMRELLQAGADINVRDEEGNTILMQWIKMTGGHSEERITREGFQLLKEAGIDLHARNKDGLNAAELNLCLYWPNSFIQEEMEKAGVPVDAGALLSAAAAWGKIDEVERLLQAGANPNYYGCSALLQCIGVITDGPKENEVLIAALLLEGGADPNIAGEAAMRKAVYSDNSEQLVPLLLQHGFRVKDCKAEDHSRWLEHLLAHRAPQKTPLADILICHGAVLDDSNWYTPYFCHIVQQKEQYSYHAMSHARHMVELGLDVTRKNKDGKTAAMLARENQMRGTGQLLEHPEKCLEEMRKRAQQADATGCTQLMQAVANPNVPAIEVYKLLRYGANVHARDARGRTALHYINSFCPQKALKAKLLMEAGADVNARDEKDLTPLLALPRVHTISIPAQQSCAPIIRMLQQAGADMTASDKNGHNKLELYLQGDKLSPADEECCELLRQYGCKAGPEPETK